MHALSTRPLLYDITQNKQGCDLLVHSSPHHLPEIIVRHGRRTSDQTGDRLIVVGGLLCDTLESTIQALLSAVDHRILAVRSPIEAALAASMIDDRALEWYPDAYAQWKQCTYDQRQLMAWAATMIPLVIRMRHPDGRVTLISHVGPAGDDWPASLPMLDASTHPQPEEFAQMAALGRDLLFRAPVASLQAIKYWIQASASRLPLRRRASATARSIAAHQSKPPGRIIRHIIRKSALATDAPIDLTALSW